jgi:lysophospholipase L1-like esterase
LLWASLIVVLVAFLEVGASLYYFFVVPQQSREMLEPLLGITSPSKQDILRYKPHPYFNYLFNRDYRYTDGFKPYNSQGFRAPEWKKKERGTIRIAAVGGSTTYGIFSRDGKNIWPAFLEQRLNAGGAPALEIINLGVTGYTSFEIIGVMAMVVPELDPDIVLINVGINDAFSANYPDEGGGDNTRFRFSWNVRQLSEFAKFCMRKSYTLRVLGSLTMSINRYLPGDLMNAMQYPTPDDRESLRNAAQASGKYFRRNLKTLVSQAKNIDAATVLFTMPLNPDWDKAEASYSRGVIGAAKRNNEIIREVGKESGVVVIDLFPHMRARELFVDAVHANLRGEEAQARLIYPEVSALVAAERRK